jgi:hypothetical protein
VLPPCNVMTYKKRASVYSPGLNHRTQLSVPTVPLIPPPHISLTLSQRSHAVFSLTRSLSRDGRKGDAQSRVHGSQVVLQRARVTAPPREARRAAVAPERVVQRVREGVVRAQSAGAHDRAAEPQEERTLRGGGGGGCEVELVLATGGEREGAPPAVRVARVVEHAAVGGADDRVARAVDEQDRGQVRGRCGGDVALGGVALDLLEKGALGADGGGLLGVEGFGLYTGRESRSAMSL